MTIQKNIKTDYGAVGDGVTDDSAAFLNFQTFGQAQGSTTIELTVPVGSYNNPTAPSWTEGIQNLIVLSTGATIKYWAVGGPQGQLTTSQAKLSRANVGESYVLLSTPSEYTNVSIGDMIIISCRETQGVGGYPSNWIWWELKQVTGTSSGRWDLDSPLTKTYSLTFPDSYNASYYPGGPAYGHKLRSQWNQTVNITGGTWDNSIDEGQVQVVGKNITITGATLLGGHGCAPSFADTIRFDTCTFTNGVEADKVIRRLQLVNCTQGPLHNLTFQSAAITNVEIEGGTYSNINGTTPRHFSIKNASISNIAIGSDGYGGNEDILFDNCAINSLTTLLTGIYIDLTDPNCEYIGNGIFRYAAGTDISSMRAFAVPGLRGFFNGTGGGGPSNWGNPFTILDYWADTNYTYFQISYSGSSLPSYSGTPGLALTKLILHPAQSATFKNCTGCADVIDLSQAPEKSPLYSYTSRTYTGNIGTQAAVSIWGRITSIVINVSVPFTGTGALAFHPFGQFGTVFFDSSNVWSQVNPTVDLKTTGTRSWTPGGGWIGFVGADSLTAIPTGAWIPEGLVPYCGVSTAAGTVTTTITTDQGHQTKVVSLGRRFIG